MKIKANYLAAATHAVADGKDVRYFLRGVCLTRHNENVRVQATDGHIMMRIDTDEAWPIDEVSEYILEFSKDQTRDIRKKANAHELVEFEALLTRPTMTLRGAVSPVQVVDSKYPDCARVWPESVSGELAEDMAFNATFFERFAKMVRAAGSSSDYPMRLQPNGSGPAIVEFPNSELEAIVMPLKVK